MNNSLLFLATCPKGLSGLLLDELAALGADDLKETPMGVCFTGSLAVGYRACLWSRIANRVLLEVARFAVASVADLYEGIRALRWQDHIHAEGSLAVDFSGRSEALRNEQFGAQKVKDAIVDGFRARGQCRPSVDTKAPDVRINVRLHRGCLTVSIDLSGDSLHRRGYRLEGGKAPLKENLAAAIVKRAGWLEVCRGGGSLIDPMCGSGTLLIEAALLALDRAPALDRDQFGFSRWLGHQPQQWAAIVGDARARARQKLESGVEIRGYDGDVTAIRRAETNIQRMGLSQVIRCRRKSLNALQKPTHIELASGLVLCNPPWGERIGRKESLPLLYRQLGGCLHREFQGWHAGIVTSDLGLGRAVGLRSHKQYKLHSGPIDLTLLLFQLNEQNHYRDASVRDVDTPRDPNRCSPVVQANRAYHTLSDGAQMLLNRLRKNQKKLKPWIIRESIDAFRLYDADIPEYAVAIDVYADRPHIAEYAPPKTVSFEVAERRIREVKDAVRVYFSLERNDEIPCKRRQRQRGDLQYQRHGNSGERIVVREGAAKLLVNLNDYLDTGLFLDHRLLRQRLAREADGKHFLNLFCYTGSATIQAALGGAATSTSVDLSNTYLDWFKDNLALNGLSDRQHRSERANVMSWLTSVSRTWDVIMLDPPSFSNSKAMGASFDIQRDHTALLEACMARLSPGGKLYFSNNKRKFRLASDIEERWTVSPLTQSSLSPDFQRGAPPHHLWLLQHPTGHGG